MKPALHIKLLITLLILPLFISATTEIKNEQTKTINKTFTVNPNATLKVNNSYGNINVITWNENKIVFEIKITASGNNQEYIQKKLNEIDVNFSSTHDLVSAETKFGKKSSNSWWNWGSNKKIKVKINYIIKMPITGKVDLKNNYGNINLDRLEGHANINCDYGKITTKELMANNNTINFDYTKGCYFEYIKSGNINADYSEFTINKTKEIHINADYTSSKIESAEDVTFKCNYGSIKIDRTNNIVGNGDYLTTIIGDIHASATLNADYGSIKINRITENANNVTIKSDYTGIKVGYDYNYDFNFNINLDYASLRDSDNLIITKEIKDGTSKRYKGYHKNQSSNHNLTIDSDYGSVTLYKN